MAAQRGRPKKQPDNIAARSNGEKAKPIELDLGKLYPKQVEFFNAKNRYVAYGGARGGGKSHVLQRTAIVHCVKYPGIKILIMRRTYNELEENHILPLKKMVNGKAADYNGSTYSLNFFNGSRIKFGHLNKSSDADEYQGIEYDEIFIDEATHFTEHEFRTLGACVRGVNTFPKHIYLTCNPGGIGHAWVKRLFVDKNYKDNENPKDYKFIFASVDDNTELVKHSPDYINMLDNLPEDRRRAWRYGDWNAMAGTYFTNFNPKVHVIKPFRIPNEWVRYRAFDYGLDMFACLWIAVDFDGRAYGYREVNMPDLLVSDASRQMHENTMTDERIAYTVAPPDMWTTQKSDGHTMAEVFMQEGIGILKAPNSRVQGWHMVSEALQPGKDGKPMLYFFENCKTLIEHIQIVQHDETNNEDVAKQPHEFTHICDALRYFCAARNMKAEKAAPVRDYDDGENLTDYDDAMTGGEPTHSYLMYG